MNQQEINIEIAKVCGWKRAPVFDVKKSADGKYDLNIEAFEKDGYLVFDSNLPNYHGDLNAMHEAENWLLKGPLTDTLGMNYWNTLWAVAKDQYKTLRTIGNASAAQRAEAFLRTLKLWR